MRDLFCHFWVRVVGKKRSRQNNSFYFAVKQSLLLHSYSFSSNKKAASMKKHNLAIFDKY